MKIPYLFFCFFLILRNSFKSKIGIYLPSKILSLKKIFFSTYFLAILACFLWSTAFVGIKLGLVYTTPLNFAGIRFFLSGLLILPFAGNWSNYPKLLKENLKPILKISLFQTFLLYSLFYIGISLAPASITAIIVGGGPLFVALMAHLIIKDDKLSLKRLIYILMGFLGILIIVIDRYEFNWKEGKEFWGMVILILANISGSYGNILVSKESRKITPLLLNSWQLMLGGIAIFILSLFAEDHDFGIKPVEYYISLFYLSFLSAVAFSIWFVLLKRPRVKVSELNSWKFLIPVFGAILSWVILPGEKPEIIPVVGMIVISFSLLFISYKNSS